MLIRRFDCNDKAAVIVIIALLLVIARCSDILCVIVDNHFLFSIRNPKKAYCIYQNMIDILHLFFENLLFTNLSK